MRAQTWRSHRLDQGERERVGCQANQVIGQTQKQLTLAKCGHQRRHVTRPNDQFDFIRATVVAVLKANTATGCFTEVTISWKKTGLCISSV